MSRPIESDYTSQVAYTRALEAYCDSLTQPHKKHLTDKDFELNWMNYQKGFSDGVLAGIEQMKQALTQPAQQEPVATVIGKFLTRKDELRTCIEPELSLGTKLYTSPPAQRKPLKDDEIGKAWSVADGEHNASASVKRRITRAIEAAHGIIKGDA